MKALSPKATVTATAEIGWPKMWKAERVSLFIIDMIESGHLDIPLESFEAFAKAKGYPQIAHGVSRQLMNRQLFMKLDKDDSFKKRMFIKGVVNGR